jgi:hypothetical protein
MIKIDVLQQDTEQNLMNPLILLQTDTVKQRKIVSSRETLVAEKKIEQRKEGSRVEL